MKTVVYDPEAGEAIADAHAERRVVEWWCEGGEAITVSTENFVEALRALVAEGAIPFGGVQISFKGDDLALDKHGRPAYFPRGFLDVNQGFIRRILEAGLGRKLGSK